MRRLGNAVVALFVGCVVPAAVLPCPAAGAASSGKVSSSAAAATATTSIVAVRAPTRLTVEAPTAARAGRTIRVRVTGRSTKRTGSTVILLR